MFSMPQRLRLTIGLIVKILAKNTALYRRICSFLKNDSGVSAVEFALLLPVMVLIYAGVVDLARGVETDKKVNRVASVVGDLISRQITVLPAQLDDIFLIGATTMAPSGGTPSVKVTFVTMEAVKVGGKYPAKVIWSRSTGDLKPDAKGSRIDIPDNLRIEKLGYIRVEAQYKYVPFTSYILPPITLSEVYYISPRYTSEIPCNGC